MHSTVRLSPPMNWMLIAALVCSVISLGGVLSAYHQVFDLLAHFRIQYIVLIFGVICLAVRLKRYWIALALVCCLSIHLFDVGRSQFPTPSSTDADGPMIRVMSSNLLASNTQHEAHIRYIRDIDPDIIVFQEYTLAWADALTSSLGEYKHKVSVPLDNHSGIALFSKLPLDRSNRMLLAKVHRPTVDGEVSIASSTLRIIGTHPPPPITQYLYRERNSQLEQLAKVTNTQAAPLVLLGDLNTTPWSEHFRDLMKNGNLHDGRRGFGILPTWPSGFLPLQIPIDHVIVNDGVEVVRMGSSDNLSSDHRIIWADLRIR